MQKTNEKITTVCIPTCNRPEQLRSTLGSLISHLEKYTRSPRILIVDDSLDLQNTAQSKKIASLYAPQYKGAIEFIDRDDRKDMASKIAQERNIREEVVNFALCGDKLAVTTGAVRNTFLLKTRGEKILTIDDDVVFRFLSPLEEKPPYFSSENPHEYWFLKDNEVPPILDFKAVDVDLLSLHENMLGKKASEMLGENAPEYIKDLEIIDTYMGAYGDSMISHTSLLLLPQVEEKFKKASLEEYQAMKETSRIIQTPLVKTVYQGIMCVSMVMGIDNRRLTPPFIPCGRAQDLVFGVTRNKAFPLKLSGYIPLLIGHERPSKEKRDASYDVVGDMTKMNKIMASFINTTGYKSTNPHENLEIIGAKFVEMAEESPQNFARIIQNQCETMTKVMAYHVNNTIRGTPEMPEFWVNDMKSISSALNSADPKSFMADITKTPREDKMLILQKWMKLYGEMLTEWEKII